MNGDTLDRLGDTSRHCKTATCGGMSPRRSAMPSELEQLLVRRVEIRLQRRTIYRKTLLLRYILRGSAIYTTGRAKTAGNQPSNAPAKRVETKLLSAVRKELATTAFPVEKQPISIKTAENAPKVGTLWRQNQGNGLLARLVPNRQKCVVTTGKGPE